jgi:hypothetical protein
MPAIKPSRQAGFLWFCTGEGLSRFDGYRFTNYTTDQGLPAAAVNDLLETILSSNQILLKLNPVFRVHTIHVAL